MAIKPILNAIDRTLSQMYPCSGRLLSQSAGSNFGTTTNGQRTANAQNTFMAGDRDVADRGRDRFYFIEIVWQLDLRDGLKQLLSFLFGCVCSCIIRLPLLIYSSAVDRRRIKAGREALAAADYPALYDALHSLLATRICSELEPAMQAIYLIQEMYKRMALDTAIDEIARLHRGYHELYTKHKDGEGLVHDANISARLEAMFDECRSLVLILPAPS